MFLETRTSTGPTVAPARSEVERPAGRYLLAIAVCSSPRKDRVSTGDLVAELGVTAASVTGMISRPDDRGLVDHERYRGVRLTERGRTLADELARRVRVVSTFFESTLDASLDERTAFEIGFELSGDAVARLHELVGSPCLSLCPEADGSPEGRAA